MVKDAVYRYIRLPPMCRAFCDTPEFQRLRDIKQLGIVYMVYPSAVHTRFEHSLGVMHLAGVVVDVLRSTGVSVSDREKQLVQLAGMLHDAGHIAWSHTLDSLLCAAGYAAHESRSVHILTKLNQRLKLLSTTEEAMVTRMIVGDRVGAADRSFLYEIVASPIGLDVDRFDYLQRDAYHTGMTGFQPDYIISCMRVLDGHIVVEEKARPEVEAMYRTRARMYRQLYRHPSVLRAEVTLVNHVLFPGFLEWVDANWEQLDDVMLVWRLRQSPAYSRLYARQWDELHGAGDTTEDDIASTINRVEFV